MKKTTIQQPDNRMEWIRNIDKLAVSPEDAYFSHYEIASECKIVGVLDYEAGKIYCRFLTTEPDSRGLYHYVLRIQHPKVEDLLSINTTKSGYYFKGGEAGELIALFSVFFQCRFYLIANYRSIDGDSLGLKSEHDFIYKQCNPKKHPKIFDDRERKFFELPPFLDTVMKLKTELHQCFVLACSHYSRALKEVSIDSEMVFIRLVSAVEVLAKNFPLSKKDNPLNGHYLNKLILKEAFTPQQSQQLREILGIDSDNKVNIRKSKMSFVKFICKYSRGYFKGGNWKAKHVIIKKEKLSETLVAIYNARSSYLHNGEPMYLSMFMHDAGKWHTDPSLGMRIGNREFSGSIKLPYTYWFEDLVRYCLLQYLKSSS